MSLNLAFSIAKSGLLGTQRALAQVAQNITNADTPGYTRKVATATSVTVEGQPLGIKLGEARRSVDGALVAERDQRAADVAAAMVRERLLTSIEAVHGSTDSGNSLGDTIAALQSSLISLQATPGDTGLQRNAAEAAYDVATRFNEIAEAIGDARQQAQDGVLSEVETINAALREITQLTNSIKADMVRGLPVGDLADQRDLALTKLSESLPVQALHQADGGLILITKGGLALPMLASGDALSTSLASMGPDAYYGAGGSIPGVTLGGVDVTSQLTGGRLGEYLTLRDATLPRYQAELDVAASQLASRFSAQGLALFTDASGAVPDTSLGYAAAGSGQIGFANVIRLASAVAANPALLRDGTHAVADTPGGPTAFTPNPANGPSGFTTLIERLVKYSLGDSARDGSYWAPIPSSGLGPDGSLSSPFIPGRSVGSYASTLTATQSADRAAATTAKERASALRDGLDARLQAESGVDPDAEMAALIQLQNAYAANARVMNATQEMWAALQGIAS
ncbi:flagellar hook-associated protein FlgK [Roseococcus sp. YIM B11640]|uniref:flagellar hook-associated protein FlgK n=1 Tax=Roseococcus sp. YIM B11640 TaxID=3133973 RepID=UPI003C7B1328